MKTNSIDLLLEALHEGLDKKEDSIVIYLPTAVIKRLSEEVNEMIGEKLSFGAFVNEHTKKSVDVFSFNRSGINVHLIDLKYFSESNTKK